MSNAYQIGDEVSTAADIKAMLVDLSVGDYIVPGRRAKALEVTNVDIDPVQDNVSVVVYADGPGGGTIQLYHNTRHDEAYIHAVGSGNHNPLKSLELVSAPKQNTGPTQQEKERAWEQLETLAIGDTFTYDDRSKPVEVVKRTDTQVEIEGPQGGEDTLYIGESDVRDVRIAERAERSPEGYPLMETETGHWVPAMVYGWTFKHTNEMHRGDIEWAWDNPSNGKKVSIVYDDFGDHYRAEVKQYGSDKDILGSSDSFEGVLSQAVQYMEIVEPVTDTPAPGTEERSTSDPLANSAGVYDPTQEFENSGSGAETSDKTGQLEMEDFF